ncbi:MAG TPA: (d)CMP kinase [Bacteroidetes bacterium]|nr:MAG: (d)CMP kinase [Rhodothermaeota bacterium MED-G64]RPF78807.1 MAG: (d)CMP kinase [Rhodothermaceae bacterium TMED105]HBV99624.1 (d)CMP kinase [Bacteroidota bacterium]|tara:strand:- start:11558 stop:12220 length:663 start_codon:yes stop_codon:yes gene_type:complete
MIIVLDGPAGSGKSSTAKALASKLTLQYLDSGALYRAISYQWIKTGKDLSLFDNLDEMPLTFTYDSGEFRVFIGEEDCTAAIRSKKVSGSVSKVAANPTVRAFVNLLMRQHANAHPSIADGRDLGTVVFPDAEVKFFLQASAEVRAQRRTKEVLESGQNASYEEVLQNIKERDRLDSTREHDPLRKAEDAIVVQTDQMTFDEQVAFCVEHILSKTSLTIE